MAQIPVPMSSSDGAGFDSAEDSLNFESGDEDNGFPDMAAALAKSRWELATKDISTQNKVVHTMKERCV